MSYRPTLAFVTLLVAVFAVGCQTNGPAPATAATPGRAVIASTGNGTTTIYLPAASGGGVQALSTAGAAAPACPDCAAAAAKYFQGGPLEAKCPVCGANRLAAIGHD